MSVDVRLTWPVVGCAAGAHAVGALVAMTAGLLLVPSLTVVLGSGAAGAVSLLAASALHVGIDAVFAAAMRRIGASAATCAVNLVLAHLPVIAIGMLLGAGEPGPVGTALLLPVVFQVGWTLVAVALGVTVGLAWVRLRGGGPG